jgi:NodT family efflux transporter outer membrane factor (OMF) lipoprotein
LDVHSASADVAGGEAQVLLIGREIPAQWWRLFRSPELNELVEKALKANPSVKSAQAALRQAMENSKAQASVYWPSVQASYSASRERNAIGTLAPTLTSGAPIFSLHTAQVAVSYVLDPFGGTRRQVESARALAESQRFQLEATYLTLTSNVVAAALQEASLRGQITATAEIVRIQRQTVQIMQLRFEMGAIAMADVVAQKASLAQSEAAVPVLQKQLAQQRDLLAALAGAFPSDDLIGQFKIDTLKLPTELPLSLPSALVRQRPDIRSAEEQLRSAGAEVGVAIGNFLPQISLTADLGTTGISIAELFKAGNSYWNATGGITQTLFSGGALIHRKRAADAALEQAAAQYQATVIAAFQNVADTLRALKFDAIALEQQVQAQRSAAESLEIVRRELDLGAVNPLALLNAQQAYQQSAINLVQAQVNRFADTAALFQALGGGWWNR